MDSTLDSAGECVIETQRGYE